MKKILIADSSAVTRSIEKEIIHLNPAFEYAGYALSFAELQSKVSEFKPDALIVDTAFFEGMKFESIIFELKNLGIQTLLFVNSEFTDCHASSKIYVTKKPSFASVSQENLKDYSVQLEKIFNDTPHTPQKTFAELSKDIMPVKSHSDYKAVFIGVSTGGPGTIQKLLSEIGADFPLPILITQHIDSVFDKNLISWLNSNTSLPVHLAESGVVPKNGNVYFAPADYHLMIKSDGKNGFLIELNHDEPMNFLRPSVDKMFFSAASVLNKKCIAVLLTGMGNDGAAGCCKIKECGGYTITEAEESCVVYGMPKAAFEAGGSVEVLALDDIAGRLKMLACSKENN